MFFKVNDVWFSRSHIASAKATQNGASWYVTFRATASASDVYLPTQYATQALAEDAVRDFLLGE